MSKFKKNDRVHVEFDAVVVGSYANEGVELRRDDGGGVSYVSVDNCTLITPTEPPRYAVVKVTSEDGDRTYVFARIGQAPQEWVSYYNSGLCWGQLVDAYYNIEIVK